MIAALLVACSPPEVAEPVVSPPHIVSDALAPALAGEVYAAWLDASGGTPPLRWTLAAGALPAGLAFNPAGAISGTPVSAGDADLTVTVTDALGRQDWRDLTLSVGWDAGALPCGGDLEGSFGEAAGDWEGVDFDAADGLAWVQIPLPSDDTTRIDVYYGGHADTYAYVAAPGTPLGDTDMDNYSGHFLSAGDKLTVDLGTGYDLGTFEALGDPITLLLAAYDAGSWSVSSTCTDGPIFEALTFEPVRLGDAMDADYDIIGDQEAVRIWTDDPLPDGVTMGETGQLSGTPTAAGTWTLTVQAEDGAGRTREERSTLGVYEVHELACGETSETSITLGLFDADWNDDPRTFWVAHTPFDATVSLASATLSMSGYGDVGSASIGASSLYYPGAGSEYGDGGATWTLSPRTYPALAAYQDDSGVYWVASAFETPRGAPTLAILCDAGPHADLAALPVIDGDASFPLAATGGTPPYLWTAAGLPEEVTLSSDGVLAAVGAQPGSVDVDVTVTDAAGLASTETWALRVGADAACQEIEPLDCGASRSGEFTLAYYEEWGAYTDASTQVWCLYPPPEGSLEITLAVPGDGLLVLAAGDPGRPVDEVLFDSNSATWVSIAYAGTEETATVDTTTFPSLADYADLPLFLVLQAYEPGAWELGIACE